MQLTGLKLATHIDGHGTANFRAAGLPSAKLPFCPTITVYAIIFKIGGIVVADLKDYFFFFFFFCWADRQIPVKETSG